MMSLGLPMAHSKGRHVRPLRAALVSLPFLGVLALLFLVGSWYQQKTFVGTELIRDGDSWIVGNVAWGGLGAVEGIERGSDVLSVNGTPVADLRTDFHHFPSRKVHSVGVSQPGGEVKTITAAGIPVPWQTRVLGIMLGLLAFTFWAAACFTWIRKSSLRTGRVFTLFALCTTLLITSIMGAQFDSGAMVSIRTFAYLWFTASFLHLSTTFPRNILPGRGRLLAYVPALVLTLFYGFWGWHEPFFDHWFRQVVFAYLLLALVGGVAMWAYSYFASDYGRYRLQTKLVAGAACLGLLPFVLLSLMPHLVFHRPIIPPDFTVMGVAAIPIVFSYVIVAEKLPTFAIADSPPCLDVPQEALLQAFTALATDLETLTTHIVERVPQSVGVTDACLMINTDNGVNVTVARGEWAGDTARHLQLEVWAASATEDDLFPNLTPPASGCQLAIPIRARGATIAILCLGSKSTGDNFTVGEINFLFRARNDLAIPLHNAIVLDSVSRNWGRLQEDQQQAERRSRKLDRNRLRLGTAYLGMGRALVSLFESRHPHLRGHSERVAELSRRIAQELKLPAQRIEAIYWAASLGDIGMMAVPDRILLKTDLLDYRERSEVELHPTRSREIASLLPLTEETLELMEAHHEAWDGTGYPRGLKGEEIPLGARIIAVADAFERMRSPQQTGPALGTAQALSLLEAGAEVKWDRCVVQALRRTGARDCRSASSLDTRPTSVGTPLE